MGGDCDYIPSCVTVRVIYPTILRILNKECSYYATTIDQMVVFYVQTSHGAER
jgi:hypothetical protein